MKRPNHARACVKRLGVVLGWCVAAGETSFSSEKVSAALVWRVAVALSYDRVLGIVSQAATAKKTLPRGFSLVAPHFL